MKFRNLISAAAAVSLMTTPVLASAASADLGRTAAPAALESEQEGGGPGALVWIIGALVLGVGIYLVVDDDDDKPSSP